MPAGHYVRTKFVPLKERLLRKTVKTEGCWIWKGGTGSFGYGSIMGERKENGKSANIATHRASWIVFNGEIPNGLCVLHKCDNPLCINPNHLFLGTKSDNTNDMVGKKRMKVGEQLPQSKLTEDAVKQIRKSAESTGALSRRYKVDWVTVYFARTRRTWKHVT